MPSPTKPGKKRKKNKEQLAVETTRVYSLSVNYGDQTDWSRTHDPNHLQQLAYPILETWFQDETLKMNILRAVLHYADQLPEAEKLLMEAQERQVQQQVEALGDKIIHYIRRNLGNINPPKTQPQMPEEIEEDSFLAKRLRYKDS